MTVAKLVTHSPAETRKVGSALAAVLEADDVVLLAGPLGAGKTEFTKGIAEGLGIDELVVSPTFTLAREYEARPLRLLHVDLYRLDRGQEVIDLGLDDLAADDAVTVVEWGDLASGLFPADHLDVQIELGLDDCLDDFDDERIITLTASGISWHRRQVALAAALAATGSGLPG
jgi:tRNA threonylcarbamoyladenosine biosynthesis protein TsaE